MNSFEKEPDEGLVWIYWGRGEEPKKTLCYWKDGHPRDLHFGMFHLEYIFKERVAWEAYK